MSRALPAGDDPVVEVYVTRKGKLFPFRTHESTRWVLEEIFKRGEYGLLHVPDWRPKLIVDIGANHGAFALFCSIHFPDAELHCYEPVRGNFELLQHNLRDVDRASLNHCGLYDADQSAMIYYGRTNTGECSIEKGVST